MPFKADLGYSPRIPLNIIAAATFTHSSRQDGQQSINLATTLADIPAQHKDRLAITQATQAVEANEKRQPHNIQTGNSVMINIHNMPLSYCTAAPGTETNQSSEHLCPALQQWDVGQYRLDTHRCNGNASEITDMSTHLYIYKIFKVCKFTWCTND
jgi:hypothetical protein